VKTSLRKVLRPKREKSYSTIKVDKERTRSNRKKNDGHHAKAGDKGVKKSQRRRRKEVFKPPGKNLRMKKLGEYLGEAS